MKKRKVEIILRGSNYRTHGLSANEFQEALIEAIQEEEKDAIENENYETAKYSKEYLEILKKKKTENRNA